MFSRPDQTYDLDNKTISYILGDEANPLNRVSEIIPEHSKVLDIGAGNGILASVFREKRKNVIIDGIEPNPYAVQIAKKHYRNFYSGNAEEFKDKILQENYDYIVLADVIEHIYDPLVFLQNLCFGLSEQTKIVLSIPNIAFGAVRLSLLNGEFNYVDSGIIEKTHIRFFTFKTIKQLVSQVNLNIEKCYFLHRDILNTEIRLKHSNFLCLSKILKDDLSSTYQFLLVLTKGEVITEEKCFGEKNRNSMFLYEIKELIKSLGNIFNIFFEGGKFSE